MKNKQNKIKFVVFSLLMVCASSCTNKNTQKETIFNQSLPFKGTHDIHFTITNDFITKNQKSDYQILLPKEYNKDLFSAASELRNLLFASSGASLKVIVEDEYQSGPYISLGNTKQYQDAIQEKKEELGNNGYRIKTMDKNIYIFSNQYSGIINGIYGFLEIVVNFSTYAPDEIYYEKKDIPLYLFDVIDIPDIQYRVGDVTNKIDGDEMYRKRLKLNCNDDVFAYVNGTLYHNSLYYFPLETYCDPYYEDFYSSSNGSTNYLQLCYTAHGNEEKLNEMLEIAANLIVETLQNSQAENVTFMQSDINDWCECETCQSEKEKYRTDAAVVIKFLNRLASQVEKKIGKDRPFNICFFAYQKTESAPVFKDEEGNYQPIDNEVLLNDHVCVYYAPIYAKYNTSFETGDNRIYAETLKAWKRIAKKTFIWFYQTNFSHYLYPYNSLPTMQERYNFIANQGAEFLFDQNQWDQSTKTAFHRLKAWMSAKLSWNVNLNYETLLDEYFQGYFYEAQEPMRQLFDEITYHMEYLERETDMSGDIYYNMNQHKYFSKTLLDGWMDYIEMAFEKIEKYEQEDPKRYEKLYTRIAIEAMSIRYMIIELYQGRYSEQKLKELQNAFMQDCFKYGIDMVAEIKEISTVFHQWGIL